MKTSLKILALSVLLASMGASVFALPAFNKSAKPAAAAAPIAGDYVEARTCSVFAGACHYNGEYMNTGRDAVMAWSFSSGSYQGVNLAGVRVAAAVTSSDNLAETSAPRTAEIVIDSSATNQQAAAVLNLLQSQCGKAFGTIAAVHRGPISFTHTDQGYNVNADGFAQMDIEYMPDNACCVQPNLVWYEPLSPVQSRKVGYADWAGFNGVIAPPWYRTAENDAFYGPFIFQ